MNDEQLKREEEIKEWAEDYSSLPDYQAAYMCGAIRADEHPKRIETQQQEMFDELDPYQKADFIKNNIAWARTCDLSDELKLRHEL